ncbi:MAG: DUF3466 family protein, partial [Armatimonadota bacterium]|nr:DUF3466 family protein [Armatimonadota bacterium]
AINNKGQIILAWSSSTTLQQNGKKVALKAPVGYRNTEGDYAINELGEIVGSADRLNAADDQRRAILWRDVNGYDLNTLIPTQSDWNLQQATDINDKGQIVGIGTYHGKTHAFLLTPRK